MARTHDLLRRFRLMAVPGAAGIAGVPVDRAALLREELQPIFVALRGAEFEAAATIARATSAGDARRARADQEAQRIVDEARDAAPRERVAAAKATKSSADAEAARLREDAREETQRIAGEAEGRLAAVVDELIGRVMSTEATSGTT